VSLARVAHELYHSGCDGAVAAAAIIAADTWNGWFGLLCCSATVSAYMAAAAAQSPGRHGAGSWLFLPKLPSYPNASGYPSDYIRSSEFPNEYVFPIAIMFACEHAAQEARQAELRRALAEAEARAAAEREEALAALRAAAAAEAATQVRKPSLATLSAPPANDAIVICGRACIVDLDLRSSAAYFLFVGTERSECARALRTRSRPHM
jgi:hypothetical protein